MGGFKKDDGAGFLFPFCQPLSAGLAAFGQEAVKDEPVCRQAGQDQGGEDRRGARDDGDRMAGGLGGPAEFIARVGDRGHPGVG